MMRKRKRRPVAVDANARAIGYRSYRERELDAVSRLVAPSRAESRRAGVTSGREEGPYRRVAWNVTKSMSK